MNAKFFRALLFVMLFVLGFQAAAEPPSRDYRAYSQTAISGMPTSPFPLTVEQQFLANSVVIRTEPIVNERGLNESFRIYFESGESAIWKPHNLESFNSNYRAEVLAYELSQLWGFNLVQPTVARTLPDGNGVDRVGSVQLWVTETNAPAGRSIYSPQHAGYDRQMVFDFLIQNFDRHFNNFLVGESGRIYSIDHGSSFTGIGHRRFRLSDRMENVWGFLETEEGKEIVRRIRSSMDDPSIRAYLVEVLGAEDANKLVGRTEEFLRIETDIANGSILNPWGSGNTGADSNRVGAGNTGADSNRVGAGNAGAESNRWGAGNAGAESSRWGAGNAGAESS